MVFSAVKLNDILPGNYLCDPITQRIYDESKTCIIKAFKTGCKCVVIDFSSITAKDIDALMAILFHAEILSSTYKKPYILMPTDIVEWHINDFWKQYNNYAILKRVACLNDEGEISFLGYTKLENVIMRNLLASTGLNFDDAKSLYGTSVESLIAVETALGKLLLMDENQMITPVISNQDLHDFCARDSHIKIRKALFDHIAISPCNHYVIEKSKIHTDTLLFVQNAIDNSRRSFRKLMIELKNKTKSIEFDLVIVGNRLESVSSAIESELKTRTVTIDEVQKNRYSNHVKSSLILDSICRSGETINNIAKIASGLQLNPSYSFALYGTKEKVYIKEINNYCHSLHVFQVREWINESLCPLCKLNIDPSHITGDKSDEDIILSKLERYSITPFHFWDLVNRTNSLQPVCNLHLRNANKDYTFLIKVEDLIRSDLDLEYIADNIYLNIIIHLKNNNITRQSIRYILTKNSPSAFMVSEKLRVLFDNWLDIIQFSEEEIALMGIDSANWPEELTKKTRLLKGSYVLLVDDGINSGWTLLGLRNFSNTADSKIAAKAVVIDRHNIKDNSSKINHLDDTISLYKLDLPIWVPDSNCPYCLTLNKLDKTYTADEQKKSKFADELLKKYTPRMAK